MSNIEKNNKLPLEKLEQELEIIDIEESDEICRRIGKDCLKKAKLILNSITQERVEKESGRDLAYLIKVLTEQGLILSGKASKITKTEKVKENQVDKYLQKYGNSIKERSIKKVM